MLGLVGVQNLLFTIVAISSLVVFMGFMLKLAKQPYVVSYIVVGIILGPFAMGVVKDTSQVSTLGSLGLIFLLFFVGMEISLPKLIANWRISVVGTLMQIFMSLLLIWLLGTYAGWDNARIVMLGFVLALSSTAVILKLLDEMKETHTKIGQNVIGILLTQDILIVVMLIVMNYLGGASLNRLDLVLQIIGAILIAIILFIILRKKEIHIPFELYIIRDHELQIFVALLFCFGFAMIAELMKLSAALGAFMGGIIVSATRSTKWVQQSLHAFQILFVSVFFVYVGMIIDIRFMWENVGLIMSMVLSVFIVNTLINGVVFLSFNIPWKQSFYGGAVLSQVGEFSFAIGAIGYNLSIIDEFSYQLILSTIALTLFFSPMWINLTKRLLSITPDMLDPTHR